MAKRIRFAAYAEEQIRERGLSEEAVTRAIQEPEQVVEGERASRKIAQKRLREAGKEYLLRVVYEEDGEEITVGTAYRTSKVSKYWRHE